MRRARQCPRNSKGGQDNEATVKTHLQQQSEVGPVAGRGKLPVHVQTIKVIGPEEGHGVGSEGCTVVAGAADGLEAGRARRGPSDGQEDFEVGVGGLVLKDSCVEV